MKIASHQLLNELTDLTNQHLFYIQQLQSLPDQALTQKASVTSWSALECIEHLNRYGNFYLPEISKRIMETRTNAAPVFKSGWLGNYFANSMLPKEKLNKMKTFAAMNPLNSNVDRAVINTFILQLQTMLDLLQQCRNVNLSTIKTSISISSLIRLKLGDTLRVVIYHNERHVKQIEKAIQ
ncbi:DinB family protein [Niabella yanshanensis]|uniref:DinB family protein n=1 Tax=Niabella yanshanensis TaxID=577386 RepID=A0ABZ0W2C2_9BACT|nr:DinB family protein [Niabella yanshanensis]WQD37415.1 DinB family protein [Niabella yanshanensis]